MSDSNMGEALERADCEGCEHCRFPGIRWPSSPDLSSQHSFVERCDYCECYESDVDAALALTHLLGGDIRIGVAMRSADVGQQWEDEPRWFADGLDAAAINKSALWPSTGYSLVVDRPERDS